MVGGLLGLPGLGRREDQLILRNPDAQDRQGRAGIETGSSGGMTAGLGRGVSGCS